MAYICGGDIILVHVVIDLPNSYLLNLNYYNSFTAAHKLIMLQTDFGEKLNSVYHKMYIFLSD